MTERFDRLTRVHHLLKRELLVRKRGAVYVGDLPPWVVVRPVGRLAWFDTQMILCVLVCKHDFPSGSNLCDGCRNGCEDLIEFTGFVGGLICRSLR